MDTAFLEPPLFFTQDHIFDLDFHPFQDVLTCSLITGQVKLLSFNSDAVTEIASLDHHKSSARISQFAPSGQTLITASKDGSFALLDYNGKIILYNENAHPQGINAAKYLDEHLVSIGDDSGRIKIWDLRSNQAVYQVHEQKESISCFEIDEGMKYLLATSLDGYLSVFDLRVNCQAKTALLAMSDNMEEDLTSVCIMKSGKFVSVSTSEGNILIFKWDFFGDFKDRVIGHPNSIDAMIKVDDHTLMTGGEDGILRGVGVFPNQILATLGQHEEDQQFPISKISMDSTKRIVASISHDNSIKFYDVIEFMGSRNKVSNFDPTEEYLENQREHLQSVDEGNDEDFEDEDSDDSDDEDSEEEVQKNGRKNRQLTVKQSQQSLKKQNLKSFYKDL